MLPTFCGKTAGKTWLISFSLLNRPNKFTLGSFANLHVVLLRDFLDLCDCHFLLSFFLVYAFPQVSLIIDRNQRVDSQAASANSCCTFVISGMFSKNEFTTCGSK
jgi:hypothetical protein